MATLPEDLVILAVGAKPRGGPNNGKLPLRLRYGMRGAMLVALALAGLVHAGGIAQLLYPGAGNAALRARLAELAGQDPAMTAPGARPAADIPDDPFRHAAQAAVQSAVHHSVHAAVSAATATSHHHSGGGSSSGGDSSPSHHHH